MNLIFKFVQTCFKSTEKCLYRYPTKRMRLTGQFRFFKTQLKTTDLSIEAPGNQPHKLCTLFPVTSCLGLLFTAEF